MKIGEPLSALNLQTTKMYYMGGTMKLVDLYTSLLKLEDNASELYIQFAQICDIRMKNTMVEFSKEEKMHKVFIHKAFLKLDDNLDLNKEVESLLNEQLNLTKENVKTLFFKKDKDFFIYALTIEKNSIDLYTKVYEMFAMDSPESTIFNELIQQERKHMLYIVKKIQELK